MTTPNTATKKPIAKTDMAKTNTAKTATTAAVQTAAANAANAKEFFRMLVVLILVFIAGIMSAIADAAAMRQLLLRSDVCPAP